MLLQPEAVQDVLSRLAQWFGATRPELLRKLFDVAVIWIVAWIAWQAVKRIARRIRAQVDDHLDSSFTPEEKRGATLAEVVRGVGRVIILVVAIVSTLAQFLAIGPILAAGGIVGLAVSFGSQSLVRDVISGFFILFENQFGLGDVIEAAGKSGTVERMTLRVVMLRDVNGVLHIIPNGQITAVSNLTRSWSRAVIDVGIGYAADTDRALAVLHDEVARLRAEPEWSARLETGPESIGVEEFTPQAVLIRSRLRVAPGSQWAVAREFRRRIKNRFQAEGIPIYNMPVRQAPAGAPAPEPPGPLPPFPGGDSPPRP